MSIRPSPVTKRYRRYRMMVAAAAAVGDALHRAPPFGSQNRDRRLQTVARRISGCAVATTVKLETPPNEATRIIYRNKRRCRNGLCPPCARTRSRETVQRIARVMDGIIAVNSGQRFAFLTLTSINQDIADVKRMLALHESALSRFWRGKRIVQAFTGHVTGLEVAIRQRDGRWQAGVHSHSIVALAASYFDRRNGAYLKQAEIVRLWQKALRSDYRPICDVRAIPDHDAARASLFETLKYAVAPHRLFETAGGRFTVDPVVAAYLADALYKKRMCRTGGLFGTTRVPKGMGAAA